MLTQVPTFATLRNPCQKNTPLPNHFNPGDHDVICGRGKQAYNATGNRRFRVTIVAHMARYIQARTKIDKSLVVISIVDAIRTNGGGFVKKCGRTQKWLDIGDQVAREKVGHALRDAIAARETEGIDPTTVLPSNIISMEELMKLSAHDLQEFEKALKCGIESPHRVNTSFRVRAAKSSISSPESCEKPTPTQDSAAKEANQKITNSSIHSSTSSTIPQTSVPEKIFSQKMPRKVSLELVSTTNPKEPTDMDAFRCEQHQEHDEPVFEPLDFNMEVLHASGDDMGILNTFLVGAFENEGIPSDDQMVSASGPGLVGDDGNGTLVDNAMAEEESFERLIDEVFSD